MTNLPLAGVRIIDFTWVGAGPYTTKILADAGAEVIKIESSKRPDVLRFVSPFKDGVKGINRSGYFANRNTSKKSFQLDMRQEESKTIIKELVKTADIVSNSFTAGTMEKWGLGYDVLKEVKEDIIFISMPMQGTTGPHKDFSGFGAMMNALIGLNHLTGLPDREPIGTGTNYPDHIPNPTHGAFAILSALRYRNMAGKGQYVELAQTESALGVLAVAVMEAANNGTSPKRKGNFVDYAAPNGAYSCKGNDEWCVISCKTEEQWDAFVKVTGINDLFNIQKFATIDDRKRNVSQLDEIISTWTQQYTPKEVMHKLQQAGVPSGVIQSAKNLIDEDSHLKYRNHFVELEHPEMGKTLYNNAPFRLSETPINIQSPAPILGADTESVCKNILKMSDEEFNTLKEKGVFQ